MQNGFAVGVHGVDFQDAENIRREHDAFAAITGLSTFGVRNHYVRFDEGTFKKMAGGGYLYDSTDFNKKRLETKEPYKVGNMWEFPLHIMDGYICFPGRLEEGLKDTYAAIQQAERSGCPYCTILFHDYQFDDALYPELKIWYESVVSFCESNGYTFISYDDAVKELEANHEAV